jgi:hypothetical protein
VKNIVIVLDNFKSHRANVTVNFAENPHAFKHEMNRTPCKSTEKFQETSCRSSKQESHNLHPAALWNGGETPNETFVRKMQPNAILGRFFKAFRW